ncbi:SDR family NAD(P)-dependent oxidoreductase [Novosphingobium sp. YJ-S2-02]|uniref:SDR family NAD(P)-dependent oxidoreductase n=1 Tax=Novosphingobium aureum TaxID=2792964 RepID=A0A931MJP8_9SPHN|nr:SDR family NAD(P)-dependent oxidoreductase [Novosphingobium aureum]MBH0112042.1 SDR family NAD(P)-dependent oxidoreductase [Novosphingobium aureum]
MHQERGLAGRTMMITGGSSGLGAHVARVAAKCGARVALVARREAALHELVAQIGEAGGEAMAVPGDVADEEQMLGAFDQIEARWGTVNAVLVNAGINRSGRALDLAMADFDAVFATNVRGAFITAREAARRMVAAGCAPEGRIVLISSITAQTQDNGLVAYSAAKAAVSHLGRLLAKEWVRTGPNVNVVSPGYFESELAGDWFETEAGQRKVAAMPRRRLMDEAALDATLLHLLGDASAPITGADIRIDDGQTL